MPVNKIEVIKQAKHPLDVLEDIYRYAKEGWEAIPEDDWDRMKWYGVFFRRTTPGYFMMRLRIPNGMLTSKQLDAVADIVITYGRDQADLTTRENIQLRWITIENVPDIFERLKAVGLTSQQSGMDNMRNVVGCPIAGLDPNEFIDASPLAQALQYSFVGLRELSNLPRKFNVSVTGCRDDCASAQAHDLSFVPATYHAAHGPVSGFNVLIGGALGGKDPKLAEPLDAFVRPEEVVALNRSVLEVYRDHGPRDARNKARLKYLLEMWGMDRLREAVEERFGRPLPRAGEAMTKRYGGDHIGIHPQAQRGLSYVGLLVPVGRLSGTQLKELACLSDVYGKGEIRLTTQQNVIIPHVPREKMTALLQEPLLKEFSPFPSPVMRGLVCCTGDDYCHFALIETKGETLKMAKALEEKNVIKDSIRIHVSGCPNACGQHHIADISLLAMKIKIDGEIVGAAEVGVGGRLGPEARLAEQVSNAVPLTELPDYLAELAKDLNKEPMS